MRSSYEGNGRLSIALAMASASYSFIGARRATGDSRGSDLPDLD